MAEIERAPVMGAEHEQAENLQVILLLDLPHCKEIAQGLAHFPVVDIQEGVMQPVMSEFHAVARLRLGDLILMVREDQVLAAGVDVNRLAKILAAHDRALDVPARASFAPGGLPVGLPFLLRLPENEI